MGRNLVVNSSVEQGVLSPDGWFHSLTGATWATGTAHRGAHSLRLTVTAATADWRSAAMPVVGGAQYALRAWALGSGGSECFLTLRWFADPGATTFLSEQNVPLPTSYPVWTPIDAWATAPVSALTADLLFRCPAPTTVDLYADDFALRRT